MLQGWGLPGFPRTQRTHEDLGFYLPALQLGHAALAKLGLRQARGLRCLQLPVAWAGAGGPQPQLRPGPLLRGREAARSCARHLSQP